MPWGVTDPARQARDPVAVDDAVGDQAHRPGSDVRPVTPLWIAGAGVGAAAQAGPEAGELCGGGGGEEPYVGRLGSQRRAGGSAVDSGRRDAGDKAAVEPVVPAAHCPVAQVEVEGH